MAQGYGIKWELFYWEQVGEHIGNWRNILKTCKFHENRVKISWEQIGNSKNPTPQSSLKRKKASASHHWLQEIFLPTTVLCRRCWRILGNATGKNHGCILMYACSVYHTPNTVWNLERTFSTQRSTQKHYEKFLIYLEGTIHKLIRTRTRKIWHLSVLTSRDILLQKSHISFRVPRRLGSLSLIMTWRIDN